MAKKKTRTKTNTGKKSTKFSFKLNRQQKVVLGSFLMLFGLALSVAFISFLFNWEVDQSTLGEFSNREVETKNWLSKFGASVSDFFMYKGFGVAAFIFSILVSYSGFHLFLGVKSTKLRESWFWGILIMLWLAIFFGFFAANNPLLGGRIGYEMNDSLQDYLGFFGTILLMLFLFIAY